MDSSQIFTNKVILIPIAAWLIAQLVKMMVALMQGKGFDFRYLVSSGGMPSSHSAMVTALAISVGMIYGFGSAVFGISVILALIVMYDAAGVRRSVSKQAKVLNHIMRELRHNQPHLEVLRADLKELIGHTPFQVIIGAIVGIIVAWVWITISST